MPIINDDSLEQHNLQQGGYGYSGQKLDDLGASEYTLVTIINDVSSSVHGYGTQMEATLKEVVKACKFSPRADNLMLRHTQFNTSLRETHGFKMLESCNLDDYDGVLGIGGATALFDASANGIAATADYAKKLADQEFMVNAIVIIITDGDDNSSSFSAEAVKKALESAMKQETLESIVTILVGVGYDDPSVTTFLQNFKDSAGLTQYIDAGDATDKKLAKLAEFVSKSISAQSQSLGTGGPSQPLTF